MSFGPTSTSPITHCWPGEMTNYDNDNILEHEFSHVTAALQYNKWYRYNNIIMCNVTLYCFITFGSSESANALRLREKPLPARYHTTRKTREKPADGRAARSLLFREFDVNSHAVLCAFAYRRR